MFTFGQLIVLMFLIFFSPQGRGEALGEAVCLGDTVIPQRDFLEHGKDH